MSDWQTYLSQASVAQKQGELEESILWYQKALGQNPDHAESHYQLGNLHGKFNRYELAEHHYREAIRLAPGFHLAHFNLGNLFLYQKKLNEAIQCYQAVLAEKPDDPLAFLNIGNAYYLMNERDQAKTYYRKALQIDPEHPAAFFNLGNCYLEENLLDEAQTSFQKATQADPNFAMAYRGLGFIAQRRYQYKEAMALYEKSLSLFPDNGEIYNNLGVISLQQEDYEQALALFEKSLRINPRNAQAINNQGLALLEQEKYAQAAHCYRQALQVNPNLPEPYRNLGKLLTDQGKTAEAIHLYEEAISRHSSDDSLRINLAKILPPLYRSKEDLLYWRSRYTEELDKLCQTGIRIQDPVEEVSASNFYLAYHGESDRALQEKYASLFRNLVRYKEPRPLSRHGKPKVAFLSKHLVPQHTIGKLFLGLAEHLSREQFDVTLFTIGAKSRSFLQSEHTHIPLNLWHWEQERHTIATQNIDILIYTDIGMDPLSYYLALERLAPVQCVLWGHPDTTGSPAMDYFLSTPWLETEQSPQEYSEQLVLLDNLLTYYKWPERSDRSLDRSHFGLPMQGNIYYCPQSLFKVHPDFDPILGSILRQDPKGLVVFIQGKHAEWSELLMGRFRATIPDVANRIRFIKRMPPDEYLHSLSMADVLLDTTHFGGGSTSQEALAYGMPIVTLPSSFLRGRITYACYQKMGFPDCIASDEESYANLAVRIATDSDVRRHMQARIRETNRVLYEDRSAVKMLEDFLLQLFHSAREGLQPVSH